LRDSRIRTAVHHEQEVAEVPLSKEELQFYVQESLDIASRELAFPFPEDIANALENPARFQTFGHVDAIYYPEIPERRDVDVEEGLTLLPHLFEEHIHLHQFRRSSAGWSLELLGREFCSHVPGTGKITKAELERLRTSHELLKAYGESIRDPLELEARYLTVLYLVMWPDEHLRDGFVKAFSLGESRKPTRSAAFEGWFAHSLDDWVHTLKASAHDMAVRHESYPKWLKLVSEALSRTANLHWKQGKASESEYLEEIGNCLEILTLPCVASLMPRDRPTAEFKGTTSDPSRRLEIACSCMLELSPEDVRHGRIGQAMSKIASAMPTLDKWDILGMRKVAAKTVGCELKPEVPLLPLRVQPAALDDDLKEKFVAASELNGDLANSTGPTLLIRRNQGSSSSVELLVADPVGAHFLEQFGQYLKGLTLLKDHGR